MKNIFISIFIISAVGIQAYSQDYLTEITSQTCECADKISDTLSTDDYNIQLGLCMIESSIPYKKKIKKDYNIDLDNLGQNQGEAEQLGQIIGMKMAGICPTTLSKLTAKNYETTETAEPIGKSIEGSITDINSDFFVTFSLKDYAGKTSKMYWLEFIKSDIDLPTSYKMLLGKEVKIMYKEAEYFDPKISEYRLVKVITEIVVK